MTTPSTTGQSAQALMTVANLRFFANTALLLQTSSTSQSSISRSSIGQTSISQSRADEPDRLSIGAVLQLMQERATAIDETTRRVHGEIREAQQRLEELRRLRDELTARRSALVAQLDDTTASRSSNDEGHDEEEAAYLFNCFLPRYFPESQQPTGTLRLSALLRQLEQNRQHWVKIDATIWPPHLELLLRSGVISQHPDDLSLIRSEL